MNSINSDMGYMNSINSDMGLILDMMPDESIIHEEIESGKPNEYYQAKAEQILQTIDTKEHYFHFVNIFNM